MDGVLTTDTHKNNRRRDVCLVNDTTVAGGVGGLSFFYPVGAHSRAVMKYHTSLLQRVAALPGNPFPGCPALHPPKDATPDQVDAHNAEWSAYFEAHEPYCCKWPPGSAAPANTRFLVNDLVLPAHIREHWAHATLRPTADIDLATFNSFAVQPMQHRCGATQAAVEPRESRHDSDIDDEETRPVRAYSPTQMALEQILLATQTCALVFPAAISTEDSLLAHMTLCVMMADDTWLSTWWTSTSIPKDLADVIFRTMQVCLAEGFGAAPVDVVSMAAWDAVRRDITCCFPDYATRCWHDWEDDEVDRADVAA